MIKGLLLTFIGAMLLLKTIASRTPPPTPNNLVTISMIETLSPSLATCDPDNFNDQPCATAKDISKSFTAGFNNYPPLNSYYQRAAFAYAAMRSKDFKYTQPSGENSITGVGTSSMLSFEQVYKYAMTIPELRSKIPADIDDVKPDSASAASKKEVLELLISGNYAYASSVWLITKGCNFQPTINPSSSGPYYKTFWTEFLSQCAKYEPTPEDDSIGYWRRSREALRQQSYDVNFNVLLARIDLSGNKDLLLIGGIMAVMLVPVIGFIICAACSK